MKKEPDKLAQDVHSAIAAGMSYGMWKAMQQPVEIEKEDVPNGWLICEYCGTPFKPKTRRKQLYCGAVCQKQRAYEKAK